MDIAPNVDTIRLLTFNLRQGGTNRIDGLARTIQRHQPDIAILTEYRTSSAPLLARLADAGLRFQATSHPAPRENGVCVVSRLPFAVDGNTLHPSPSPRHWLQVRFPAFDLGAIYNGIHSPGYAAFANWLDGVLWRHRCRSFIMMGDLNWLEVGDGGNDRPGWVEWLAEIGYADAWRKLHPGERDFSWTNHNGTRTRVDYAFLTRRIAPSLHAARYVHDQEHPGVSDHDPLIVDLRDPARISRTAGLVRPLRRRTPVAGPER